MAQYFDHIATAYDQDFTNSAIGIAQRQLVYKGLNQVITHWDNLSVLDLNCGSGEDALYFAKKGAQVLATDISSEMVNVTEIKTAEFNNVLCQVADINHLENDVPNQTFDLIFSNFGKLNFLSPSEMEAFIQVCAKKLNPEGKLAFVIMPEFCAWEALYFLSKVKFSKAFRRKNTNGVSVNVNGETVKTYYFSPLKIVKWATDFKLKYIAPIGLFVPPSYLNNFFKNKNKTLQKLQKMDEKQSDSFHLSSLSDHYLICLSLR